MDIQTILLDCQNTDNCPNLFFVFKRIYHIQELQSACVNAQLCLLKVGNSTQDKGHNSKMSSFLIIRFPQIGQHFGKTN